MKTIISAIMIIISPNLIISQNVKDISAGVIDFLIQNPKTANKMNSTEKVALEIVSDLFKKSSERKHQLEYSSAGSDQITIVTPNGKQAKFVKDPQDNVYLLIGDLVYPLDRKLIAQAKKQESVPRSSLKEYDETVYEGSYEFRTTLIPNPAIDIKLRDKPNLAGKTWYVVEKSDIIYVIDRSNTDYFKVYVNGYVGYVRSYFLKRKQ